jgi:glycosyltransferase involved in cell wall biosynthesis
MRHLLVCSRSHDPQGGADRIVVDLCRELPRRGWRVTLGLTQGRRFNDVSRFRELMGADLPIVEIDGRRGTRAARLASLRGLVRDSRPDVVLSMRVFDAYEAVALEKAAGSGPRLAVGIRSFEAPYLADLNLYRDSVDLCVTSGKLLAALATGYCGVDAARVVSIGGGVHGPEVELQPRVARGALRLLYAGRLDGEQKRIMDIPPFLDALEALGVDCELDVAGTGPGEAALREALRTRIEGGSARVHGWVSREQLYREFYPRADCFVHFAAWEGMTIAPREAMAHGAVPVISRFDGLRLEGHFRDGETALVFPVGDVRAAAACVQRLSTGSGLLPRLSAQAMRSQSGEYSFGGSMDAWAGALDRCLQQPLARGTLPRIDDRNQGRLSRWGVPGALQPILQGLAGRRVEHASPGSEWPTSSGSLSPGQVQEIAREAARMEAAFG